MRLHGRLTRVATLLSSVLFFAACPCPDVRPAISFESERAPGAYAVTLRSDDGRQLDPSSLSFALVSYDQRRVYERVPFRVDRIDSPTATSARQGRSTLHIRLKVRAIAPGFYLLYLHSPFPVAEYGKSALPVSFPDRTAAHLRDLQHRYAGRSVWVYGALSLRCGALPAGVTAATINVRGSVRITRLERAPGITAKIDDFTSNAGLIYDAVDPLLVHVRIARDDISSAGWARSTGPRAGSHVEGCSDPTFMVSDAWDLERTVSLHPPDIDLAKHPALVGLTHEEAAFEDGFPWIYGTRDQLLRMPKWTYPLTAPNAYTLEFRGDRVVHDDSRNTGFGF